MTHLRGREDGRTAISAAMTADAVRTKRIDTPAPCRYAVVGSGWRALAYLRLAHLLPDLFEVTGAVTRREEPGRQVETDFGVRSFRSVEDALAADRPDFVVLSVPWPVTPELTRALVERGVPVLAETPPAPDVDGMRSLWADVGAADLVQVAEQYPLMPLHAARLGLVRDGLIGVPGSAQVSSTHLYHAVALMRAALGAPIGPVTVDARAFHAPLVDPITPAGWTFDAEPKRARTVLATIDFGDDRSGLYDFTDNQWWNPVRPDRFTVRGSTGEVHDETVVRMADATTPVVSRIERAVTGVGMNYEGADLTALVLDGRPVFRNPYEGARLNDDEVGTAALLSATGAWARGEGPAPYPLAEGMHDHRVGIAIEESAERGTAVEVGDEAWGGR
ncbi:Gfo/Idh/MocA family protein [Amnibacterium endophyticum]|uniref:Gfo/Idh/MocA family protein n=1 Tax=Amnibacterium endophyticum TaxID=2109337 RepID=A0ABW4LDL6_9MICO